MNVLKFHGTFLSLTTNTALYFGRVALIFKEEEDDHKEEYWPSKRSIDPLGRPQSQPEVITNSHMLFIGTVYVRPTLRCS